LFVANNIITPHKKRGVAHMQSIRLNIEGLEQKETQVKVINQLEGMRGVQDIYLSEDETFLDVNFDEETSDAEINNHLQNNGYKINKLG
jgi:copper chaperone CopZ